MRSPKTILFTAFTTCRKYIYLKLNWDDRVEDQQQLKAPVRDVLSLLSELPNSLTCFTLQKFRKIVNNNLTNDLLSL